MTKKVAIIVLLFILLPQTAYASSTKSTSYTVTETINQGTEIAQDAYLPSRLQYQVR
jgi:hypothetical protein